MLSVIIETGEAADRLPRLLAALAQAAVEGLAREVQMVGGPLDLLSLLREETGAEITDDLATAIRQARSDQMLILPASIRLKAEWLEALSRHVRDGGGEAVFEGEARGFLRRGPFGVIISRKAASALAHPDLQGLRRQLGSGAARIG